MGRSPAVLAGAALLATALLSHAPVPEGPADGREAYAGLALAFEPNYGQTHPEHLFLARGPDYGIFLRSSGATIRAHGGVAVRLELVNGNDAAKPAGLEPLPGRSNYLVGSDPSRWRTGIPHYGRVRFEEVHPGIDLEYYGSPQNLEFDFIVKPDADPGRIRLRYDGVDGLDLDEDGAVVLATASRPLRQQKPRVLQETGAGKRLIEASYVRTGPREVGLSLGPYDSRLPLRIDPVLVYSTYLGGDAAVTGGNDYARAVAVDPSGNVYIAGATQSASFPATRGVVGAASGGGTDAFITKLNAGGNAVVYSTYLGGTSPDEAFAIAADAAGSAYVAGYADSTNFPITGDAYQRTRRGGREVFVAKLAPDGKSLEYSTYFGGESTDEARGLAIDASGNAWVVGRTYSMQLPVSPNAAQAVNRGGGDAFAAKFDPAGKNLIYSTFLGGASNDEAAAVTVDASGNAYVTGVTWSSDFPVSGNAWRKAPETTDAFVTKFTASGSIAYSTFLGGAGPDYGTAIALGADGNAYVAGRTSSSNLTITRPPVTPPSTAGPLQGPLLLQAALQLLKSTSFAGNEDGFVMVLSADGASLLKACYLGGEARDLANAIAVSPSGDVFVGGETQSRQFPTTGNAAQRTFSGGMSDAFLVRLNASDFRRVYSSFLGGSRADAILALAVDAAGAPHGAGTTSSLDFPATAGLIPASARNAGLDGFAARWQPEGMTTAYAIIIGGTGGSTNEEALDIALDGQGQVYVTGKTYSSNFPVTPGALQNAHGGGEQADAFVAKIDPAARRLVYATYLGGAGEDSGTGIAVDSAGAAYISAESISSGLPRAFLLNKNQGSGAFIAKLTPQGDDLEYLSVLGGNATVFGGGIRVDSSGNAYVATTTRATDLPVSQGAPQSQAGGDRDLFLMKLDPTGNRILYATYLGGSAVDEFRGMALDGSGNVYVTGYTTSQNFPAVGPAFQARPGGGTDAFVAKLNAAGTALVYSTYLGGSSNSDMGQAVAVDSDGHAYVAGGTNSPNFPTTPGPFQLNTAYNTPFLAKFKPDGSGLVYSCRFEGNLEVRDLALDAQGSAYITGMSQTSQDFPLTDDAWLSSFGPPTDAFLLKVNPEGNKILYGTFFGGTGADRGNAVAVDSAGNVYIAGQAGSSDLPVTEGVFQAVLGGTRNSFVAKVDMAAPTPAFDLPVIRRVRNEADEQLFGGPALRIGPGAIISIEGEKLAAASEDAGGYVTARTTPVPTRLGEVRVFAGANPMPLFSVSPTRIVAQMFYGAREPLAEVTVARGSQRSRAVQVPIARSAPGILATLKEDLSEISKTNTVRPGDTILLAVTGAGLTNPPITSGQPAPESPPYTVAEPMTALMAPNAQTPPLQCEIQSFALAPGYVGIALARVRISPQASTSFSEWSIQLKTSTGEYSNARQIFFPQVVRP